MPTTKRRADLTARSAASPPRPRPPSAPPRRDPPGTPLSRRRSRGFPSARTSAGQSRTLAACSWTSTPSPGRRPHGPVGPASSSKRCSVPGRAVLPQSSWREANLLGQRPFPFPEAARTPRYAQGPRQIPSIDDGGKFPSKKTVFGGRNPGETAGFWSPIIDVIRKYNTSHGHVKRNSGVSGGVSGAVLRLFSLIFRSFAARMRPESGFSAKNGASGGR